MKKRYLWVLMLFLMLPVAAYARDITINVPPPPSNFPQAFPKYTKCFVEGKRRACYDKDGVKQLLFLWERYQLLAPLAPVVTKQQELIKKQTQRIETGKREAAARAKESAALRRSIKALNTKITRDEKRRKLAFMRDVIIVTGAVVLSVAAGVAVGYAIGKL